MSYLLIFPLNDELKALFRGRGRGGAGGGGEDIRMPLHTYRQVFIMSCLLGFLG